MVSFPLHAVLILPLLRSPWLDSCPQLNYALAHVLPGTTIESKHDSGLERSNSFCTNLLAFID